MRSDIFWLVRRLRTSFFFTFVSDECRTQCMHKTQWEGAILSIDRLLLIVFSTIQWMKLVEKKSIYFTLNQSLRVEYMMWNVENHRPFNYCATNTKTHASAWRRTSTLDSSWMASIFFFFLARIFNLLLRSKSKFSIYDGDIPVLDVNYYSQISGKHYFPNFYQIKHNRRKRNWNNKSKIFGY